MDRPKEQIPRMTFSARARIIVSDGVSLGALAMGDKWFGGRTRNPWNSSDLAALAELQTMGVELQVVELPDLPLDAISLLLNAEAAAAFDNLTMTGRDTLLA